MKLSDFDYQLPDSLIAQRPLARRGASRLFVVDPDSHAFSDRKFSDIVEFLSPGDLLVLNDTKVVPARLYGQKSSGGKIEVLVERILDERHLLAHIRSSKSPRPGGRLILEDRIRCTMLRREDDLFVLYQDSAQTWLELLEQYGHMPLPPYIQRDDEAEDRQRYQTVYARHLGAVAAPTAGLHFEQPILDELAAEGVNIAYVTLHVGAGTFQPVRVDNITEHVMHAERVRVSQQLCDAVERTHDSGNKVVAVGTTVVRSLEAAAARGKLKPFDGDCRLFITPGFRFNIVDAMITNFHLPKSTLLMLVSAFAGRQLILDAYRHAVEQEYRFFSYGDAMYISGRAPSAQRDS
ncbi:MAG: tRNA preQ1(34) S-adenosylmethionine ribosyltransferase-isomerase QueA [Gammaproteobacteria bacterium]|nr:MAG: tRNA preQ1(34) S-adenosylmethionine ribosyltransferase-isomerase QueA [Gammaproteobacteria bacterium]